MLGLAVFGYNRGSCIRGRRAGERRGSFPWFAFVVCAGLCVCAWDAHADAVSAEAQQDAEESA